MAKTAKNTEEQVKELAPKKEKSETSKPTKWKIKDNFFDKEKTFIDKVTRQIKVGEANWRHLHIGGKQMTFFKGEALTDEELSRFDKEAKNYWLEAIKK